MKKADLKEKQELERKRIRQIMSKPVNPKATSWYWRVKGSQSDMKEVLS